MSTAEDNLPLSLSTRLQFSFVMIIISANWGIVSRQSWLILANIFGYGIVLLLVTKADELFIEGVGFFMKLSFCDGRGVELYNVVTLMEFDRSCE